VFLGIKNGGAISSIKGVDDMIILPITQLQLILSMAIGEVFLLSDPNYSVSIGSENYFSLAVGAFVAGVFYFHSSCTKSWKQHQIKASRT